MSFWRAKPLIFKKHEASKCNTVDTRMSPHDRFDLRLHQMAMAQQLCGRIPFSPI